MSCFAVAISALIVVVCTCQRNFLEIATFGFCRLHASLPAGCCYGCHVSSVCIVAMCVICISMLLLLLLLSHKQLVYCLRCFSMLHCALLNVLSVLAVAVIAFIIDGMHLPKRVLVDRSLGFCRLHASLPSGCCYGCRVSSVCISIVCDLLGNTAAAAVAMCLCIASASSVCYSVRC
jgi:hypothetical protein